MVRSTYSSFSILRKVASINLSNIQNEQFFWNNFSEKFLGMPRIKPGAAGWEAQTPPLCYEGLLLLLFIEISIISVSFTELLFVDRLPIAIKVWGHTSGDFLKCPWLEFLSHHCRIPVQHCYPLHRPIEQTDSCGQVENIVVFFQKLLMVALPFTTVLSVVLVWQVPILEQWLMVA